MTESERKQIIALIQREVIPAIGCTEPIASCIVCSKSYRDFGGQTGENKGIVEC